MYAKWLDEGAGFNARLPYLSAYMGHVSSAFQGNPQVLFSNGWKQREAAVQLSKKRMSAIKSFLKYTSEKDKSLMALYLDIDAIPKKKDTKVHRIEFSALIRFTDWL